MASKGWSEEPSSRGSLTSGSPGPGSPGASSSTNQVVPACKRGAKHRVPMAICRRKKISENLILFITFLDVIISLYFFLFHANIALLKIIFSLPRAY
jgi:hypothetical protein